jgi:ligand-binding SRPBCC domain-containing protein
MAAVMEMTVLIHGRSPDEVIGFCLDGANFPLIFPEPIRPIGEIDPTQLKITAGREFDFLHWMLYRIQCKWRVRIAEVRPSVAFVDQMLRGPMKRPRHEHIVSPDLCGTLYTDRVSYEAYGGRFAEKLFVNRYMNRLFEARHRNMRRLLEVSA